MVGGPLRGVNYLIVRLTNNQFLHSVDLVAVDAYKVGTLGKVGNIHLLHAVALAFHSVAEEGAAVHIDDGDIDESVHAREADGGSAGGGVGIDGDVHTAFNMRYADAAGGEFNHVGPGADVVGAADGAYVSLVVGFVVEVVDGGGVRGNLNHGALALAEAAQTVLDFPLAVVVGAGSPVDGYAGAVDRGGDVGYGFADSSGERDGVAVVALNIAVAAEGADGSIVLHAGGEAGDGGGGSSDVGGLVVGSVEHVYVPLSFVRACGPVQLNRVALNVGSGEVRRSEAGQFIGDEGSHRPIGVAKGIAILTNAEVVSGFGSQTGEGVGHGVNSDGGTPAC